VSRQLYSRTRTSRRCSHSGCHRQCLEQGLLEVVPFRADRDLLHLEQTQVWPLVEVPEAVRSQLHHYCSGATGSPRMRTTGQRRHAGQRRPPDEVLPDCIRRDEYCLAVPPVGFQWQGRDSSPRLRLSGSSGFAILLALVHAMFRLGPQFGYRLQRSATSSTRAQLDGRASLSSLDPPRIAQLSLHSHLRQLGGYPDEQEPDARSRADRRLALQACEARAPDRYPRVFPRSLPVPARKRQACRRSVPAIDCSPLVIQSWISLCSRS